MSDAMDYDPALDDVHIHLKETREIPITNDLVEDVVKGRIGNYHGVNKYTPINPSHYRQGNIEVIDFILDQDMDYLEGNVVKYVSRYKYKNGLEDLQKALWYLERLIERNSKK